MPPAHYDETIPDYAEDDGPSDSPPKEQSEPQPLVELGAAVSRVVHGQDPKTGGQLRREHISQQQQQRSWQTNKDKKLKKKDKKKKGQSSHFVSRPLH